MKYEKPTVIIYDEEVMNELKAMASSTSCYCMSGMGILHTGPGKG
jgi:hypothetical protein